MICIKISSEQRRLLLNYLGFYTAFNKVHRVKCHLSCFYSSSISSVTFSSSIILSHLSSCAARNEFAFSRAVKSCCFFSANMLSSSASFPRWPMQCWPFFTLPQQCPPSLVFIFWKPLLLFSKMRNSSKPLHIGYRLCCSS